MKEAHTFFLWITHIHCFFVRFSFCQLTLVFWESAFFWGECITFWIEETSFPLNDQVEIFRPNLQSLIWRKLPNLLCLSLILIGGKWKITTNKLCNIPLHEKKCACGSILIWSFFAGERFSFVDDYSLQHRTNPFIEMAFLESVLAAEGKLVQYFSYVLSVLVPSLWR